MRRSYLLPLSFAGLVAACADNPGQPAAIQERLTLETFQSCDALESYIEDEAVRDMQLQLDCLRDGGWCGGGFLAPNAAADSAGPSKSSGPAAYTKTNTQVAGVDEADFMKNDGTRIFVLSGQKLRAVKSWPADQLGLQGSLNIEGYPSQMYLDEKNRVVVFSSVYTKYEGFAEGGSGGGGGADIACAAGINGCGYYYGNTTKVTVVDVSDVANLKVVSEVYLPGNYANSRRIGGSVRLVLSDWFRYPSTVQFWPSSSDPNLYQDKGRWNAALDALKAQNEKLIRGQALAHAVRAADDRIGEPLVERIGARTDHVDMAVAVAVEFLPEGDQAGFREDVFPTGSRWGRGGVEAALGNHGATRPGRLPVEANHGLAAAFEVFE